MGIATVNQAGSIGAIGATLMAGYRLFEGKKSAFYPLILIIGSIIPITFLASTYELNVKNLEERNLGAIYITAFFVIILVYGIAWSFWRSYKTDNVLKEVVTETCITTSMVFIILLGAAMLTSGFRAFGGEELVRDFLQDLPGGFWTQFIVVMVVIFLLGFFLDFIEIAVVVVPIIAPILLAETGANVTAVWLGVMIGVNLQTSFLTPPFGFALFYLKGVAPKIIQTLDIWKGVVPFIALQLIGLGIVGFYPSLVNYLPNRVYLTSNVAPPPMNPKLQYCLQEYKFANFETNGDQIKTSINEFDDIILANLPADKLSYFQRHVDNSKYSFELVDEVKSAQSIYDDYAVDYRDLHFKTRKKQKKILKLNKKIDKYKAEIRNLDDEDVSDKNKILQKIENVKLEIEEIQNTIPQEWKSKNDEFNKINKAKNLAVKKYKKTVDNAYEDLLLIKEFINHGEKFEELSQDMKLLKSKIDNNNIDLDFVDQSNPSSTFPFASFILEILFILLRFSAFWICLKAFLIDDYIYISRWIFIFSSAWTLGLLVPSAPGGIGVFESFILLMNGESIPKESLLLALISYRLLVSIADLFLPLFMLIKRAIFMFIKNIY